MATVAAVGLAEWNRDFCACRKPTVLGAKTSRTENCAARDAARGIILLLMSVGDIVYSFL